MSTTASTSDQAHTMQCMEVWGGNIAVEQRVSMPGIDAWVFSRPYRDKAQRGGAVVARGGGIEVGGGAGGGDIHYLTTCATGSITRLMIADVSGHGSAVSEIARSFRMLLGKYANYVDQSRFVTAVNARFGQLSATDARFSGLFATAVVATYFSPTGELSVVNAGHPRPIVYHARERLWAIVAAPEDHDGPANIPLGVLDDAHYSARVVRLAKGDLALFYTDSLIEARAPGGKMLGEDGLVELLNRLVGVGTEALVSALLSSTAGYTRGVGPSATAPSDEDLDALNDDVSVLLIRPDGTTPKPSVWLSLVAFARIVRSAFRSLRGGGLPAALPEISLRNIGGMSVPGFKKVGASDGRG